MARTPRIPGDPDPAPEDVSPAGDPPADPPAPETAPPVAVPDSANPAPYMTPEGWVVPDSRALAPVPVRVR